VIWLTILVALCIPLAAVILDSPVVRSWADRRRGLTGDGAVPEDVKLLVKKVETLENEVETMTHQVAQLQESQQFLQRLLEDPAARQAAARLPKPNP
jgi:uncharacterized protein YlxW (UPF0749 family)